MGHLTGPPLNSTDKKWIRQQHVFFVATAPLDKNFRVNVSPKSAKEFRIVNETTVSWLDYSGSGSETAAHLMENGRITVMFVAFTGAPKILRIYGTGRIILPLEMQRAQNQHLSNLYKGELLGEESCSYGFRAIITVTINRITQSCGKSIPFFDYQKPRMKLEEFAEGKGYEGMIAYRQKKNSFSIDGLASIAQLETQSVPSTVVNEKGYYMSTYDSSPAGYASKIYVYFFMLSRSFGLKQLARDIALCFLGAAVFYCISVLARI